MPMIEMTDQDQPKIKLMKIFKSMMPRLRDLRPIGKKSQNKKKSQSEHLANFSNV